MDRAVRMRNGEWANGRRGETAQDKKQIEENDKLTANEREYMKRISPQRHREHRVFLKSFFGLTPCSLCLCGEFLDFYSRLFACIRG
jgi:hypothetical protein